MNVHVQPHLNVPERRLPFEWVALVLQERRARRLPGGSLPDDLRASEEARTLNSIADEKIYRRPTDLPLQAL
jgi:hypothetical protein